MFNYIVTIHNSEDHLRHVLQGIQNVRNYKNRVYCVLDGCTDRSEAIVDEFGFEKIITPDVRETKAISIALEKVKKADYYVILQDDVILQDPDTEEHIRKAYEMFPDIGVLGFRHGANFGEIKKGDHSSEVDLVQNIFQPSIPKIKFIDEGQMTERQVVYKSPICISHKVLSKLGGYDKRFEPIAHDDTEYCIRAMKAGFRNFVCALKVLQPPSWGGTRRFTSVHQDNFKNHLDHFALLMKLYPEELKAKHPSLQVHTIWKTS